MSCSDQGVYKGCLENIQHGGIYGFFLETPRISVIPMYRHEQQNDIEKTNHIG